MLTPFEDPTTVYPKFTRIKENEDQLKTFHTRVNLFGFKFSAGKKSFTIKDWL